MGRAKATQQLERIVAAAENGVFPAKVTELYAFGSFARGALQPHDLDLIVIHEAPPAALMARLDAEVRGKYGVSPLRWRVWPHEKFQSLMRKVMCRPGEAMDIIFARSLDEAVRDWGKIGESERVLVWSDADRDWHGHLATIKVDEAAGRFERGHFANIKRFGCDLTTMDQVSEALRQRVLKLTRVPAESIKLELNGVYQHWLDHWNACEVMGQESMKLLPYGMWWMQQQRGQRWVRPNPPHQVTMLSQDRKYVVCFGRPPLCAVFRVTCTEQRSLRVW